MSSKIQELKPKILILNFSDEISEEDELVVDDLRELYKSGIEWKALTLENSPFCKRLVEIDSKQVEGWKTRPREILDLRIRDALNEAAVQGYNLVHVSETGMLGSVLPWMLNQIHTPVVLTEGSAVAKKMRHLFQSFFYPRIDAVLVPSKSISDRVGDMRPVFRNKVQILYPGLDFEVFNPEHFDFKVLRSKWGIEDDCYLVGMVASQDYTKAQASFIKAAASFLRNEELASRTKFVIVGFNAEKNPQLIEMIHQFHLEEKIILAHQEEFLPQVLGTLDVFLLPSSKAIYGLQALEALAIGTPIICAQGPDSFEWIGNSQAGLLIRSGDAFDLQRKLKAMLEDPDELKNMGKRAVEYARAHYDRKLRTKRLIEIYESLIRRRKRWAEQETRAISR